MRTINSLFLQIQIWEAALRNQKHRYWFPKIEPLLMSDLLSVVTRCNKNQPASTYSGYSTNVFLVQIVSVLNSFLCCMGWTMQLWMMDVAEGWRSSTIQCTCTEDEQEYGIQKTTAHKDVQEYTEGDWVPLNVRVVTKSFNVFCFQNKSSSCHENNIQHFRLFLGPPFST